jgi:hypothetical protein
MVLTEEPRILKRSSLQRILIEGHEHWNQPGYDPDCSLRYLSKVQCKKKELRRRDYKKINKKEVL